MTGTHLTDQELSDLLDGSGTESGETHVDSCDLCRDRLEVWKGVVLQVAGVPVVSDAQREAAVAAALKVVPLAGRRRHGRIGSPAMRIAAAAAAVVVVAGVGFAAAQRGGGGGDRHLSSSKAQANSPASSSATPPTPPTSPAVPSAAGSAPAGSAPTGSAGYAPAAGSVTAAAAWLGDIQTDSQLVHALQVPGRAGTYPDSLACRSAAGSNPAPSGGARLTWRGSDAVVFVYATQHGHTAAVRSTADCSLLSTASY